LMGVAFEVLREAGSRLPRQVGQAVSVVGAVVVGEAATRASLISPLMLIVPAVTAITSFLVPFYAGTATLWLPRLLFTILAGMFGLVGVSWGFIVGLYYLSALRSFGTPYLSPSAPFIASDVKDFMVRVPWWAMVRRPKEPGSLRPQRKSSQPPGPGARTTGGKRERP
ncbi:MAG TPA: spore germination protein, partial [Firmicutes bacterium]|nr:spore germination protein [Bacillota bacterium]